MKQGLALFGGAFNPPHLTHCRIAEAALSLLPIEELHVLPCGSHPIKRERDMAPAAHRLAMCELAFGKIPGVRVSDLELRRAGPSYSVDTLAQLKAEAEDRELYWLIGSDNLHELHLWHDYARILELAPLVIFPRTGYPIDEHALRDSNLSPTARQNLLSHSLDLEPDSVNATAIREQLRRGQAAAELDPSVSAYVSQHRLYR